MGVFQCPSAVDAPSTATNSGKQEVCRHWRVGRCDRLPCPFLHSELPGTISKTSSRGHGGTANNDVVKKVCDFWMKGKCRYGDNCRFLHSWSLADSFSLLGQLDGHQKVVTGIALPSGSDKLYTGSDDGTVRVWDCHSGHCTSVISLDGAVGCMISEGPWIFIGLTNLVRAWNTESSYEQCLTGCVGRVYAMAVYNDVLFAGAQEGSLFAWKFNTATDCFELARTLTGHADAVVSLVVGGNRLYSASMDSTIRLWNLETLQCMQILTDHKSAVTSVLCWEEFLLSCSLDKTIRVWAGTEGGNLEVTYTQNEEHGLLSFCGTHDSSGKPVLLCSCNDSCIRVYELPSFVERGRVFAKEAVRGIHAAPVGGLFFTGDGTGQVKVWKWRESTAHE